MKTIGRANTTVMATVALGALILTAPAHAAGYGVTVYDTARAGTIYVAGGGTCTYDHGSLGGACSTGFANYGGVASATINPTGGNGAATSVTSAITVSGGGASATSNIKADLSTASIHLYANDSDQTGNCSSATVPCGYSQVSGGISDTLHFSVAGATANTVTPIKAIFTLEGSMIYTGANVDTPNSAYAEIYGALNFAGTPSRFDLINDVNSGFATRVNYLDNYPSGIANTWTTNANHTVNVSTFTYNLVGASGTVNFDLNINNLICDRGFTCDFSNTAKFALVLQPGTTFTSDSGVFLTAPVTGAVPEPASWIMMLTGFGMLGGAMRRRAAAAAA